MLSLASKELRVSKGRSESETLTAVDVALNTPWRTTSCV